MLIHSIVYNAGWATALIVALVAGTAVLGLAFGVLAWRNRSHGRKSFSRSAMTLNTTIDPIQLLQGVLQASIAAAAQQMHARRNSIGTMAMGQFKSVRLWGDGQAHSALMIIMRCLLTMQVRVCDCGTESFLQSLCKPVLQRPVGADAVAYWAAMLGDDCHLSLARLASQAYKP